MMRSKEYDYLAARLIEEREASALATNPAARKAHQELGDRYGQMMKTLAKSQIVPREAANLA